MGPPDSRHATPTSTLYRCSACRTAGAAESAIPGNLRSRNIDDQGNFEIRGVVPGSYELVGQSKRSQQSNDRKPASGSRKFRRPECFAHHHAGFQSNRAGEHRGTAIGLRQSGLAEIRVMFAPDSAAQIAGAAPAAPVQADGTFTLQQVGRDDYRITVSGMPRNAYVKTARYGATDVLNEGLRLDRQPTGPSRDRCQCADRNSSDGTVQNDRQEASANVTVVLIPDFRLRNRLDLYRTTSTDATGHFHIEGVPPETGLLPGKTSRRAPGRIPTSSALLKIAADPFG